MRLWIERRIEWIPSTILPLLRECFFSIKIVLQQPELYRKQQRQIRFQRCSCTKDVRNRLRSWIRVSICSVLSGYYYVDVFIVDNTVNSVIFERNSILEESSSILIEKVDGCVIMADDSFIHIYLNSDAHKEFLFFYWCPHIEHAVACVTTTVGNNQYVRDE